MFYHLTLTMVNWETLLFDWVSVNILSCTVWFSCARNTRSFLAMPMGQVLSIGVLLFVPWPNWNVFVFFLMANWRSLILPWPIGTSCLCPNGPIESILFPHGQLGESIRSNCHPSCWLGVSIKFDWTIVIQTVDKCHPLSSKLLGVSLCWEYHTKWLSSIVT